MTRRSRGLANRPGEPYPATFRISGLTENRTRISATPGRCRTVGPSARLFSVDRMGVEPITPTLQGSVAPNGMPAHLSEVRPGLEPGLPPYHGGVLPQHLQTIE